LSSKGSRSANFHLGLKPHLAESPTTAAPFLAISRMLTLQKILFLIVASPDIGVLVLILLIAPHVMMRTRLVSEIF
jgi:hypothetical protein